MAGAQAEAHPHDNPDEPLVVYRSFDRDGATYALDRHARERLRAKFGTSVHLPPRVFIAHETSADHERIHGSVRRQVVLLLTGLSAERLGDLGPIEFRDPVTETKVD